LRAERERDAGVVAREIDVAGLGARRGALDVGIGQTRPELDHAAEVLDGAEQLALLCPQAAAVEPGLGQAGVELDGSAQVAECLGRGSLASVGAAAVEMADGAVGAELQEGGEAAEGLVPLAALAAGDALEQDGLDELRVLSCRGVRVREQPVPVGSEGVDPGALEAALSTVGSGDGAVGVGEGQSHLAHHSARPRPQDEQPRVLRRAREAVGRIGHHVGPGPLPGEELGPHEPQLGLVGLEADGLADVAERADGVGHLHAELRAGLPQVRAARVRADLFRQLDELRLSAAQGRLAAMDRRCEQGRQQPEDEGRSPG